MSNNLNTNIYQMFPTPLYVSKYKGDMTELQPNVTFHMIAVMQFGSWGVEASHSVRVTDKGFEKFIDFPSDLFIKD